MPKTVSSPLLAHMQGEVTTLATCWKIVRTDGQAFYFTDHDQDLIANDDGLGDQTYVSAVGYTRTAVSSNSDMSIDNLEVTGIFDDATITNEDLNSGLWDYAKVFVFLVNWADSSMGVMKIRRGNMGDVQGTPSGIFKSQLNGLVSVLNHNVGDLYQATCRVDLFSTGFAQCNADSTGFIKDATVTQVTDSANFQISVTEPRAVDTWFNDGVLTFTSGSNNGRRIEIKSWTQATSALTTFLPMPMPIQVGDTLSLYPGCDKSLLNPNGCKLKFNNVVNRQAEDYIPGNMFVLQGPSTQQ